jgi:gamma-glutamylcyclotransferase (GGCT)/AIG2-like uncharacterized protein YtfP
MAVSKLWSASVPPAVRRVLAAGRATVAGEARVRYFAYGSNMEPEGLARICPSRHLLGAARLRDHRLAFTRRSRRRHCGVADLVPCEGLTVWGGLYELRSSELDRLGQKEGEGWAYERASVVVELDDGGRQNAFAHRVMRKEWPEVVPSSTYMEEVLSGARACGLPNHYLAFLQALGREARIAKDGQFRHGLLVRGTGARQESRGLPLIKMNPQLKKELNLKSLAAVVCGEKAVLARVTALEECDPHSCELDQSARHALGMPGFEVYGGTITAAPVRRVLRDMPFVRPRAMPLQVHPPSWLDSEKQIAVLHPKTISLLGLIEGEWVRLYAVEEQDAGYGLRLLSRRVFGGSAPTVQRGGKPMSYPDVAEAYLDSDGRRRLGVEEGDPVMVQPDVLRLVASRLLFYGVTLFLSGAALVTPFVLLGKRLDIAGATAASVALGLALVLTILLVLLDIRGRVHY